MSKEAFEKVRPMLEAIPREEVQAPNMPSLVFVGEADNLHYVATRDKAELKKFGMDVSLIDELQVRSSALRAAQANWGNMQMSKEDAAKQWIEDLPAAEDLRNKIEHYYRFAFRKQPDLLRRVASIEDGDSNLDFIQDLADLADLGRKNVNLLKGMKFDLKWLDEAEETAERMGDLLGIVNGERTEDDEAKIMRDRAFTYLKFVVDEIREFGKFVFWQDESKLKGYRSQYRRRSYERSRQSANEQETEVSFS